MLESCVGEFSFFNKVLQHQQQNEIFYSFTKQNEGIILSNVRGDLHSNGVDRNKTQ